MKAEEAGLNECKECAFLKPCGAKCAYHAGYQEGLKDMERTRKEIMIGRDIQEKQRINNAKAAAIGKALEMINEMIKEKHGDFIFALTEARLEELKQKIREIE